MTIQSYVTCTEQPVTLFPAVKRFYKQVGYPAKPGRLERVFTVSVNNNAEISTPAGNIIAAVRVIAKPLCRDQQWYCLRSLATAPEWRRQGIATTLLRTVFGGETGAMAGYCFALEGTHQLYANVGFVVTPPALAPALVREGYERYRRQGRKICIMIREPKEVLDV